MPWRLLWLQAVVLYKGRFQAAPGAKRLPRSSRKRKTQTRTQFSVATKRKDTTDNSRASFRNKLLNYLVAFVEVGDLGQLPV